MKKCIGVLIVVVLCVVSCTPYYALAEEESVKYQVTLRIEVESFAELTKLLLEMITNAQVTVHGVVIARDASETDAKGAGVHYIPLTLWEEE
jgi:hypothetical protein